MLESHERAGARDPEVDAGQADVLGGTQDVVDVRDEAAAAARRGAGEEELRLRQHELLEVRDRRREGEVQGGHVLRRVLVV